MQRRAETTWNRPARIDEVVLTETSTLSTLVDMTGASGVQVARGAVEIDEDGTRQGTLLFPPGVEANVTLADGSIVPAGNLSALTIRVTEFTVGPDGRSAMPGELPPNSAYTYAMDLSADGASAAP